MSFLYWNILCVFRTWVLKNCQDDRKVREPKVRHKGAAALPPAQPLPPRGKTPRAPPARRGGGGRETAGGSRPAAPAQPIHPIPSRPLSAPGCHRDRSADRATPTRRCLRADGLGGAPRAAPPPRHGSAAVPAPRPAPPAARGERTGCAIAAGPPRE